MVRIGRKPGKLRRGGAASHKKKRPLAKDRNGTSPPRRSIQVLEHLGPPSSAVGTNGTLLCARKVTIPQAARGMGIGITSLRRIIARGDIPVLKITGRTLLLESDVDAFIAASRVRVREITRPSDQLRPLPAEVAHSEHLK